MENKKDKTLAGILSFLVPGLGQLYAGNVGRGVIWFLGYYAFFGICLAISPFMLIFALFAMIWCIGDAVEMAKKQNQQLSE